MLKRYQVIRYGHLEEIDFEFGDQPKIHLILGANESGKSTLLNSFIDFYFGIPSNTDKDYLFPKSKLELCGDFQEIEGNIYRKKARSFVFYNEEQETVPTPFFLEQTNKEEYLNNYLLSHQHLSQGPRLLKQGGLNDVLFAASGQIQATQKLLSHHQAQGDELFTSSRATTKKIPKQIEAIQQLYQTLEESTQNPEEWHRLRQQLAELREKSQELRVQQSQRHQELQKLATYQENSESYQEYLEASQQLELMEQQLAINPTLLERWQSFQEQKERSQAEGEYLKKELEGHQKKLESLPQADLVLEQQAQILELQQSLGIMREQIPRIKELKLQVQKLRHTKLASSLFLQQPTFPKTIRQLIRLAERAEQIHQEQRELESPKGEQTNPDELSSLIAKQKSTLHQLKKQLGQLREALAQELSFKRELSQINQLASQLENTKNQFFPEIDLESLYQSKPPPVEALEEKAEQWQQIQLERQNKLKELKKLESLTHRQDLPSTHPSNTIQALEEQWRLLLKQSKELEKDPQNPNFSSFFTTLIAQLEHTLLSFEQLQESFQLYEDRLEQHLKHHQNLEQQQQLQLALDQLQEQSKKLKEQARSLWPEHPQAEKRNPQELLKESTPWLEIQQKFQQGRESKALLSTQNKELANTLNEIWSWAKKQLTLPAKSEPPENLKSLLSLLEEAEQTLSQEQQRNEHDLLFQEQQQKKRHRLELEKNELDKQWSNLISPLDFPSSWNALDRIEMIQLEQLQQQNETLHEIQNLENQIQELKTTEKNLKDQLEPLKHLLSRELDWVDATQQLSARLQQALEQEQIRNHLKQQLEQHQAKLEKALADQERYQSQLKVACQEYQIDRSLEKLGSAQLLLHLENYQKQLHQLSKSSLSLEEYGDFSQQTPPELEARKIFCQEKVQLEQEQLETNQRLIGETKEKLKAFEHLTQTMQLRQTLEEELEALSHSYERYLEHRYQGLLLESMLSELRENFRPEFLTIAQDFFATLTGQRYHKLAFMGESDPQSLMMVTDQQGQLIPIGQLSEATIVQLFLSLKLAFIIAHSKGLFSHIPILLDDVLMSFDDERSTQAFTLFQKLTQEHGVSIVYLTHHQHLLEVCQKALLPEDFKIHRL